MNNESIAPEKGNKHVKVEVRYVGNPGEFKENFMPEDLVESVKVSAMRFFQIAADPSKYFLQFGDAVLNDSLTLNAAGLSNGHERAELILSVKDNNDTDGGIRHA